MGCLIILLLGVVLQQDMNLISILDCQLIIALVVQRMTLDRLLHRIDIDNLRAYVCHCLTSFNYFHWIKQVKRTHMMQ